MAVSVRGRAVTVSSCFVPPKLASRGFDADEVQVSFTVAADGRASAVTVKLQRRRRRLVAGVLTRSDVGWALVPDPRLGATTFPVPAGLLAGCDPVEGAAVVARFAPGRRPRAVVELAAGPFDPADPAWLAALSLVRAFDGLGGAGDPDSFDWLVSALTGADDPAAALSPSGGQVPGASLPRRDRRDELTFTIDDPSTRDLDDAISVAPLPDGSIRVGVHIADVAATVTAGSPLDRSAAGLATSVYLASMTLPMLPAALSEDALSLIPGRDRDCLSVDFTVAADGTVSDVVLAPSVICSDARLTYDEVQAEIFDAPTPAGRIGASPALAEALALAAAAASRLGVHRSARPAFPVSFDEASHRPVVRDGVAALVPAAGAGDAQLLIERLMVAANEAVGSWLVARDLPALYRTHLGVDPAAVDDLVGVLVALGNHLDPAALVAAGVVPAGTGGDELLAALSALAASERLTDPALLTALVEALPVEHREMFVAVLSSKLSRARYETDPAAHAALGARPYAQFTSPIRRYADLVVHRAVRAALAGEAPPAPVESLDALALWVNARAGAAARAEASERASLWASLLTDRLDAGERVVADGQVLSVSPAGLRVRVDALGVTGFVAASRLGRSRLALCDRRLHARAGGVTHRVGDRMALRLVETDVAAGSFEFAAV